MEYQFELDFDKLSFVPAMNLKSHPLLMSLLLLATGMAVVLLILHFLK